MPMKDKLTLKQIRVLNGLTQSEFAAKYGLSLVSWNRIENKKTKSIKAVLFLKICEDFNVDPLKVIL